MTIKQSAPNWFTLPQGLSDLRGREYDETYCKMFRSNMWYQKSERHKIEEIKDQA
jgi:hypothetical protein